jgi:hypothetical protein
MLNTWEIANRIRLSRLILRTDEIAPLVYEYLKELGVIPTFEDYKMICTYIAGREQINFPPEKEILNWLKKLSSEPL